MRSRSRTSRARWGRWPRRPRGRSIRSRASPWSSRNPAWGVDVAQVAGAGGGAAGRLEVSDPTAAWHLRKLVEAGYVQPMRQGRRVVFHAASLGLEATEGAGRAGLGG